MTKKELLNYVKHCEQYTRDKSRDYKHPNRLKENDLAPIYAQWNIFFETIAYALEAVDQSRIREAELRGIRMESEFK